MGGGRAGRLLVLGDEVPVEVLHHPKALELVHPQQRAQAVVADNVPLVRRVLQLVLLDVRPHLLDRLRTRGGLAAHETRQLRSELQRLLVASGAPWVGGLGGGLCLLGQLLGARQRAALNLLHQVPAQLLHQLPRVQRVLKQLRQLGVVRYAAPVLAPALLDVFPHLLQHLRALQLVRAHKAGHLGGQHVQRAARDLFLRLLWLPGTLALGLGFLGLAGPRGRGPWGFVLRIAAGLLLRFRVVRRQVFLHALPDRALEAAKIHVELLLQAHAQLPLCCRR
mmetsp:Transcript_9262/g.23661  ORF Transcript_9262/g.23661 Transcript_9262/m.23661 type:complete len:280 (+) Transcript_9262:52-891(+)